MLDQALLAAPPARELDITGETCPMTFVRTRLALDRLRPGETLLVRLRGAEPRASVPRSAALLGHEVLAEETGVDDVTRLLIKCC
jgi:tRNA 2-thiouridine synthesizing protein A